MGAGGFFGQYRHALDDKGRVSVPARFRKIVDDEARDDDERGLHLTVGLDGCLFAYTTAQWDDLQRVVLEGGRNSIASQDKRRLERRLFGQAEFCRPDAQGRILIPEFMRERAKLGRQVVFVGVLNRMEIWDAEAWDREEAEGDENYEKVAKNALKWEDE